MPNQRKSMRKIKTVLRLKFQLHLSDRQIARSCALARSTVAEYVRRARRAGLTWPLPEGGMTGRFRTGCFLPQASLPLTHVHSPTSPPFMRSAAGTNM